MIKSIILVTSIVLLIGCDNQSFYLTDLQKKHPNEKIYTLPENDKGFIMIKEDGTIFYVYYDFQNRVYHYKLP